MSETQHGPAVGAASTTGPRQDSLVVERRTRTPWVGWVFFAGVIMILIGVFQAVQGLVAIFNDNYYLVSDNGLIVSADYTVWGWVHLGLGVLIALAGLAVLAGQLWGRIIGVTLAVIGAIVNLGFLGAYPIWSLMLIALDVIVIYALIVHGDEAGT
jgi:hypothetical protein